MMIFQNAVYTQEPVIIRSTLGSGGLSSSVSENGKRIIFPQSISQLSVTGIFLKNGMEFRQGFVQPVNTIRFKPANKENSDKSDFKIFPNPVTSKLYINPVDPGGASPDIIICDLSGRLIKSLQNNSDGSAGIDMSSFAKGVYILTITDKGKKSHYKIIKN